MKPAHRTVLAIQLVSALWCADPWDELSAASAGKDAASAIEALLRTHPDFLAARFNLGTILLATDPAKAAEQLTRATADPALAADAWHNLALARWKQGRLEEALMAAEEAAKRASGDESKARLRDELRRVAVARADAARRAAEEAAKKLAFAADAVPEARVGEPYRAAVPLRGGTPPYVVVVTAALPPSASAAAGTTLAVPPPTDQDAPVVPAPAPLPSSTAAPDPLPPGLSLSRDGVLGGVPATAGSFRIPLAVVDAAGGKVDGAITVTVLPVPAVTTAELPEAIIGVPYRATLSCEGLRRPVWSAQGLPPGLRCAADGTISGTADACTTATVTVTASEQVVPPQAPHAATRSLALVVGDSFAPDGPLPAATAGAAYDHRLGVRGPAMAYRWKGTDGAPLAVESDGRFHGTIEREGETRVPAELGAGDGRSRALSLPVTVNPRPLIAAGDPLRGTVGQPMDVQVPRTGGTPPFTWTVTEGSLPAGVRIDPDGRLRGAPREPGKHTLTLRLADRWGAATQAPVTVEIGERSDGKDQADQKQDPSKDHKQDQQKQGDKQDQQKQDQQAKDRKQDQPGKEPGKDPQDQQGKEGQQDQAKAGGQDKDGKDARKEAGAAINQMATDRWLDQLPQEDRGVLRYQLLDGGERKPEQKGRPW